MLALELSPHLVADFGPCLVLEFALDTVRELARPLDRNPSSGAPQGACALPGKEEEMKRLMFVLALCLAVAIPSFGVEHVITHSAKVAAKDSYKAAKYSVKETGKFLKVVF